MSKTPYVIAGLGLGACVVLSLMMQHLLEVKKERDRPAVVLEIEQVLGGRLVGPATLTEMQAEDGGMPTLVLRVPVLAGLDKEKVAHSAGNLLWLRRDGEGRPGKVLVVVRDEDGLAEEFDIPRPFRTRRSTAIRPPKTQPPKTRPPKTQPPKTPQEQKTDPAPPKDPR